MTTLVDHYKATVLFPFSKELLAVLADIVDAQTEDEAGSAILMADLDEREKDVALAKFEERFG